MNVPVTAKAALLRALLSGPGFGLELIGRVEAATGGKLVLGQGSVYPALRDLEAEGLVVGRDGVAPPGRGGRPPRRYRLTGKGERVTREHLETVAALFGLQRSS